MAPKTGKVATRATIRWTHEEQAAIAERMVELQDTDPTLTILNAMRAAQVTVIDAARQRPLRAVGTDKKWLDPALKAARAAAASRLQESMRSRREATPAQPPAEEEVVAPASDAALAPPLQLREALEDFFVDVFRGVAVRLLRDPSLHQSVLGALTGRTPAPPPGPHKPELQPRKRVLVVGLLNGQAQEILTTFGREIDLRCLASDELARLQAQLPGADAVVIMTKFIGNAVENVIKGSSAQLVRVDGGMSRLREELRRFVRV